MTRIGIWQRALAACLLAALAGCAGTTGDLVTLAESSSAGQGNAGQANAGAGGSTEAGSEPRRTQFRAILKGRDLDAPVQFCP
jgi:hypothetical protein